MHPLDNVIWQALVTRHAQFAQASDRARRFIADISPLSGFEKPSEANYESLARLVSLDGTLAVFLDHPYESRANWEFVVGAPLLQMVAKKSAIGAAANGNGIVEL